MVEHVKRGLRFVIYAGLCCAIQIVILIVLWRWDALLDKYVFFYYPTIRAIELLGGFSGESNLIAPFWIGVPLGIFLYSIIFASLLTFRPRQSPTRELKAGPDV